MEILSNIFLALKGVLVYEGMSNFQFSVKINNFGFALLRFLWLEINLHHFLNQSEVKHEVIDLRRVFPRLALATCICFEF